MIMFEKKIMYEYIHGKINKYYIDDNQRISSDKAGYFLK